ncbi:protein FAR1-RELATED SEQUENCE 5-like [Vicia villosa]|uniref:protein FAR1-RELATED SEQUENCE 5-like n=1 Tax=Vicia villosa TaxID=3911 RepID=UPI00273CB4AA|nr:protein FAR1-RELATED SEQUENCE 5-like [Vicia villosa]
MEDWKPKLKMIFDSIEDAWKFWVNYGGKIGFGVRKQYSHKNKNGIITSYKFVCCKEGIRKPDKRDYKTINPRPETRTNCQARLGIKNMDGKFMVVDFVEEHNHNLHLQETTHMLPSQRKVSQVQCQQIDLADDAGLQQRKSFDLMSKEVGGRTNLGFIRLDQKNYLRKKRQRSMVHGEAGYLLYFGDVISLDSTYCTNSSHRPLAVFSGFNHHRKVVIFGAALLYDETIESYKWLFETFLEAHKQKMPQTVFTDQDHAMARALMEVMPGAYHGLCTWHLMQNCIKHLGNLMKDGSHFLSDFKKCMYEYENEDQFEEGWRNLLVKYDVKENTWLQRVYTIKEKWASCYMKKVFTLGMRSTQLSESVNVGIKGFMNVNLDIIKFFKRFEDVVEEKRYSELKCEYEARQKIPRLRNSYSKVLQQVSEIYTPSIFDQFQHEYELFETCSVKNIDIQPPLIDCVIIMESNLGEWQVSFDLNKNSICCSCRKFESFGILCCHCLRLFIHMDVKSVPEQYILKRWTKLARSETSRNVEVNYVVEDVDLSPAQRYKEICPRLIRIATEACRNPEAFSFLCKITNELDKHILKFQSNPISSSQVNEFIGGVKESTSNHDDLTQAKGFKKREGKRSSKRPKGWVERQPPKRKKNIGCDSQLHGKEKDNEIGDSQTQVQYEVPNTSASVWLNNSYNIPSMENNNTSQFGTISFTRLLMENLHGDASALTNS